MRSFQAAAFNTASLAIRRQMRNSCARRSSHIVKRCISLLRLALHLYPRVRMMPPNIKLNKQQRQSEGGGGWGERRGKKKRKPHFYWKELEVSELQVSPQNLFSIHPSVFNQRLSCTQACRGAGEHPGYLGGWEGREWGGGAAPWNENQQLVAGATQREAAHTLDFP